MGLAGSAASFLLGILFLEPEGKRIHAAMEAHGPTPAEAVFHVRRINVASRVELCVLYLVVFNMVLKPSTEDTGTLIVGAAALLAALAYGARGIRRPDDERKTPAPAAAE